MKRQRPPMTDEQEAEITEALTRVSRARAAVVENSEGRRNVGGSMVCPVCKDNGRIGVLAYEVHSNGHIWGRCNENGCVCWME